MRIKRTLGTLALASTLALAGCSDDDGGDDTAGDAASESPSPTGSVTEETDEPEGEVDVADFLEEIEAGLAATTTARMDIELVGEQSAEGQGAVDYTTDPPNLAMTITGFSGGEEDVELRLVDGVVYVNLGAVSQGKFFELTPEQLGSQTGLGGLTDQFDPKAQLEELSEGIESVSLVGEDQIGDAEADHYVIEGDGAEFDEIEVWLDDRNRLVQIRQELPSVGTVTSTLFDFGADVGIEKPARSEIQQVPGA